MTYEYRCVKCGHEWEEEQRIKDDPTERCPECGEPSAQRQICCAGFVLNGECWARDGYR